MDDEDDLELQKRRDALWSLMDISHELGLYEDCPLCIETGGHSNSSEEGA